MIHLQPRVRAITVFRPWGTLIARGRKTIEVRIQPTPWMGLNRLKPEDRWLAIHQSKLLDSTACDRIEEIGLDLTAEDIEYDENAKSTIVALARVGWVRRLENDDPDPNYYAMRRCSPINYGIYLQDVHPVRKFIRIRGQQGIWYVDRTVIERADPGPRISPLDP